VVLLKVGLSLIELQKFGTFWGGRGLYGEVRILKSQLVITLTEICRSQRVTKFARLTHYTADFGDFD